MSRQDNNHPSISSTFSSTFLPSAPLYSLNTLKVALLSFLSRNSNFEILSSEGVYNVYIYILYTMLE